MSKDTPITELPGIAPSAVVQLNRIGIVTTGDLLSADYEQLAVLLDCFHDADRLIAEARRLAGVETVAPAKKPARSGSAKGVGRAMREAPAGEATAACAGPTGLAGALALAARALESEPDRSALARRLGAVTKLLNHGGGDDEAACALLVELAESGAVSGEDVSGLGARVSGMLEECVMLRAVPVSPSGHPPRMYLEMASRASAGARRVCAALHLAQGPAERSGPAPWYARLLAEVLSAGSEDALVNELRASVEAERQAA